MTLDRQKNDIFSVLYCFWSVELLPTIICVHSWYPCGIFKRRRDKHVDVRGETRLCIIQKPRIYVQLERGSLSPPSSVILKWHFIYVLKNDENKKKSENICKRQGHCSVRIIKYTTVSLSPYSSKGVFTSFPMDDRLE